MSAKRHEKNRWRYRSCDRKERFRNQFDAQKKAKHYGMRAYACQFCRGWHLASRPGEE